MSTLREWVEILKESEDDETDKERFLGVLMGGLQIFRSAYHGRQCTEQELYASCLKWTEHYGFPTEETVDKWLDDMGKVAEIDIPDSLAFLAVTDNSSIGSLRIFEDNHDL